MSRYVIAGPQPEWLGLGGGQPVDRAAGPADYLAVNIIKRHAENGAELGSAIVYRLAIDLVPATAARGNFEVGERDLLGGETSHMRSLAIDEPGTPNPMPAGRASAGR